MWYIIFHTPQKKVNPLYLDINKTVIDRGREYSQFEIAIKRCEG